MRWFERLERYNFTTEYNLGNELIEADAVSRSVCNSDEQYDKQKIIIKKHENGNHIKNLQKILAEPGYEFTKREIQKTLKFCMKFKVRQKNRKKC